MEIKTIPAGQIGTFQVEIPCLTIGSGNPRGTVLALQHGGELSPLWVLKEFLQKADAIKGTATIIPVANPFGMVSATRNEPIDGKDLNRQFPGNVSGDFSARLAARLFELCRSSDFVIDLHTFSRQSPFLVGYTGERSLVEPIISRLQPDVVWKVNEKRGEDRRFAGSLDGALTAIGVPAVFIEMPNYQMITPALIMRIAQSLVRVFDGESGLINPIPEFQATYLYADQTGLFEPSVAPLQTVQEGDVIGEISLLPTFNTIKIFTPSSGTVLTVKGRDLVRTGSKVGSIGRPVK